MLLFTNIVKIAKIRHISKYHFALKKKTVKCLLFSQQFIYCVVFYNESLQICDQMGNNIKNWMAQIRANFLILAVFLVLIGLALSVKHDINSNEGFNFFHAFLILIGVVSAHISVNLFNEYSDFKTKIDFKTNRTPFSGGSGMMIKGYIRPGQVYFAAVSTLLLSAAIGIYFTVVSHWSILPLAIIGAFSIVFYTNLLTRYVLGEFFAGINLGSLVVIGTFIAMNGTPVMSLKDLLPNEAILLAIPPGILTSLLLLINQFPDVEADKTGGRKHLIIMFGWRKSAWIYSAGMFLTFGLIVVLPLTGVTTNWIYLALLPLPLAIKASITAIKHGNNIQKLVPALGSNVITVLATDLLIATALFIDLL